MSHRYYVHALCNRTTGKTYHRVWDHYNGGSYLFSRYNDRAVAEAQAAKLNEAHEAKYAETERITR